MTCWQAFTNKYLIFILSVLIISSAVAGMIFLIIGVCESSNFVPDEKLSGSAYTDATNPLSAYKIVGAGLLTLGVGTSIGLQAKTALWGDTCTSEEEDRGTCFSGTIGFGFWGLLLVFLATFLQGGAAGDSCQGTLTFFGGFLITIGLIYGSVATFGNWYEMSSDYNRLETHELPPLRADFLEAHLIRDGEDVGTPEDYLELLENEHPDATPERAQELDGMIEDLRRDIGRAESRRRLALRTSPVLQRLLAEMHQ